MSSEIRVTLSCGTETVSRRADLSDASAVQALHDACSPGTRYARYLAARRGLQAREWETLTDPERATTFLTFRLDDGATVAMSNLVTYQHDAGLLDLGLLVVDSAQRRGLGRALLGIALHEARLRGARAITVTTGRHNYGMRALLRGVDAVPQLAVDSTVDFVVPL